MPNRELLMKEIEDLPLDFIDEVYHYVEFIKTFRRKAVHSEIMLASEASLAKEWLSPEEDAAWEHL